MTIDETIENEIRSTPSRAMERAHGLACLASANLGIATCIGCMGMGIYAGDTLDMIGHPYVGGLVCCGSIFLGLAMVLAGYTAVDYHSNRAAEIDRYLESQKNSTNKYE